MRYIDTSGGFWSAVTQRCLPAARSSPITRNWRPLRGVTLALAAAAVLLTPAAPAFAHHSYAMFDLHKQVEVRGTLKEVHWTNPHGWLVLAVRDAGGNSTDVKIECPPVGALLNMGWQRDNLKPGDAIAATISPMRDGSPGGSLLKVVLADGRELSAMPKIPGLHAPSSGAKP